MPLETTAPPLQRSGAEQLLIWSQQSDNDPSSRSFWMINMPQNPSSNPLNWTGMDIEAEINKKRKFDNVDDLRAEVCKRAKSNPLKLGLLGNLSKKRPHSALSEAEDTNTGHSVMIDDIETRRNKKKLKEPDIAEDLLECWIDDLVSNFNSCHLGLGEAVPDQLPKEP